MARACLATGLTAALMTAMVVVPTAAFADPQCGSPAAALGTTKKLLIAGDSVTNASSGDYTWRYWLWKFFQANSVPIDFVGDFNSTLDYLNPTGNPGPNSHDYYDCAFDWDHEARSGTKIADYNTDDAQFDPYPTGTPWITGAMNTFNPDVVVEFAGFNDLYHYEETHGNVPSGSVPQATMATNVLASTKKFVENVQANNPNADVLVVTIPSPNSTDRYQAYNTKLAAAYSDWSTATSTVKLVNPTPWSPDHSWDLWHPDGQGDAMIANSMAAVLHSLEPGFFPAAGPVPDVSLIGPNSRAVLNAPTLPADNQVALSWTLPTDADRTVVKVKDVTAGTGYVRAADLVQAFYRQADPSFGTAVCGNIFLQSRCTTTTVTGLTAGHQYSFKLSVGKGHALSPLESTEVTATPTGSTTVVAKSATAGARAATVKWNQVVGAKGYKVLGRTSSSASWKTLKGVTTTTASLTGLAPGLTYQLAVVATFPGTSPDGAMSNVVTAKPTYKVLAGPKPKLVSATGHKFKATWTAVTYASKYLVQVKLGSGAWTTLGSATKATYLSKALTKGKTYSVRIRPYDGPQAGTYSAASSIKIK